jgi:cytochrome c-type biogenesis protein CcmH
LKGEVDLALAGGTMNEAVGRDFQRARTLDPKAPAARFFVALEKIRRGDVGGGLADWRGLEADLDPADPRRPSLAADIAQVQASGKAPEAAAPPVAPPQIQAMVDGLAARLKARPDDPAGWVRLVRAYAVLGEAGPRDAALAEARQRYAGRPDVLKALDAALAPPS